MRLLSLPLASTRPVAFWQDNQVRQEEVLTCAANDCAKLALQRCVRCQRAFCNTHVRPVERDLPTRGLQRVSPYWYCHDCLNSR